MSKKKEYVRFPLARRIEHVIMLLSFGMLAITGLPQKYPNWSVSLTLVNIYGGIELTRLFHHISAVVMMLGTMWHILVAGYKIYVDRTPMSMLPLIQDAKDAWQAFSYNIGLAKHRPQMGRFTFEEKMEYWAFVWGAVVMGATGFMMWNPITSSKLFPGEFIPAAKAAHGAEAVLAVLAILIWHFYGVHFKIFNKAMWTGKMTETEMLHEHPLELADIKAGLAVRPVDPKLKRKRQMVYFPIAIVATIIMLAGVYGFIGFESTVVAVIPSANNIPAFLPQTPTPFPTFAPTPTVNMDSLTFNGYVGFVLKTQCGTCHGAGKSGGLSVLSYAELMAGGQNGPVIVAGNSASSPFITLQEAGGHLGQFDADELVKIKEWINAGAPEK